MTPCLLVSLVFYRWPRHLWGSLLYVTTKDRPHRHQKRQLAILKLHSQERWFYCLSCPSTCSHGSKSSEFKDLCCWETLSHMQALGNADRRETSINTKQKRQAGKSDVKQLWNNEKRKIPLPELWAWTFCSIVSSVCKVDIEKQLYQLIMIICWYTIARTIQY